MKTPGPEHPIKIESNPHLIRIVLGGVIVAESTRALTLHEATMPPVLYIPREDVEADLFEPSSQITHCEYKGDANYFNLTAGGLVARNAAWTYERPYSAAKAIAGHFAFYSNKVDAIEELRD